MHCNISQSILVCINIAFASEYLYCDILLLLTDFMIVTIVGAGEIGRSLAEYMLKRNHDVNVIDYSEDKCKTCAKEIEGAVLYRGDAIDEEFLKHAALDASDVLVITPVDDELAIRLSTIAKKTFGVPYIISMMDHDDNLEKLKSNGVEVIISQTKAVLQSFESALDMAKSETLHHGHEDDIKFVRVEIELDNEVIGWSIDNLKVPKECMLLTLSKKKLPKLVEPDQVIQAHDVFFLLGNPKKVEKLRELMTRSGTS